MLRIVPPSPRHLPAAIAAALGLFIVTAIAVIFASAAESARAEVVTRTVDRDTVQFRSPGMPTGTRAKSAVVFDAQTGKTLWALRPTDRRLIASTTKIMTALVAIERTKPDELLTATNYPAPAVESTLGLVPGERMTAQDLIRALMLVSANDAADTLAARTASSRAAFVGLMNEKARALGLRGTRFGNPVGLDMPRTYSTAADLAKLTQAAMKVPRFSSVVGRRKATLRSGAKVRRISNRNKLVQRKRWVTGVKTGHTLAAGYLLVSSAEKLDATVISVVTGEPTEAARDADSLKLLTFGRGFYRPVAPLQTRRSLYKLPVELQDIQVAVHPTRDVRFAVRNGERVTVTLRSEEKLKGPLAAGTRVGTATVLRGGKQIAAVPVVVKQSVPEAPISAVLLNALGQVLPWLLVGGGILLLAVVLMRRRRPAARRPGYVA